MPQQVVALAFAWYPEGKDIVGNYWDEMQHFKGGYILLMLIHNQSAIIAPSKLLHALMCHISVPPCHRSANGALRLLRG